jgi:hypothetical protein
VKHDDHALARAFERLDPARTPADAPLGEREFALLNRIKASRQPVSKRIVLALAQHRPGRTRALWAAAGVVTTALLIVVPTMTRPTAAVALTPPPLDFASSELSREAVLERASALLGESRGPSEARREASYTGWYMQYDHLDEGVERIAIQPQAVQLTWSDDLSARQVITASQPYWPDGDNAPIPTDQAASPGTVLMDTTFAPGEFVVPTVTPGTSANDARVALAEHGMASPPTASSAITAINSILTLWTLTADEERTLLEALLSLPDATIRGTTTDRAGREVIGVSADSESGRESTLLISLTTGRIVGIETTTTTPIEAIPAGSTTEYTIWEDPQ